MSLRLLSFDQEIHVFPLAGQTFYTTDRSALPSGVASQQMHLSDLFTLQLEATEIGTPRDRLDREVSARLRLMAALQRKRVDVRPGRTPDQLELVVSEGGAALTNLYLFADLVHSAPLATKALSFAQGERKGEFITADDLIQPPATALRLLRSGQFPAVVQRILRATSRQELKALTREVLGTLLEVAPDGTMELAPEQLPAATAAEPTPDPLPASAARLTDDQRFTSEFPGSVAIDAGAGSGKTFVLTRRLLNLIRGGLRPEELVAVTFTEAAASELQGRLQGLLEREAQQSGDAQLAETALQLPLAQISTIHALCARIVRDHPLESGAGLRFQVKDEAQASMWLDGVLPGVLGALPAEAFGEVSAEQALESIRLMLKDPHLAEAALQVSLASANAQRATLEEQIAQQAERATDAWDAALRTLAAHGRDTRDPLEEGRRAVLQAAETTGSWATRFAAMHAVTSKVRTNAGNAGVWGKDKTTVLAAISTLRQLAAPDDALTAALWQVRAIPVLERLYRHVQDELDRLKSEQEFLTFADLERLAARALAFPEVQAYYHARWRAVCVDEFQDTSPLQWQILSALAPLGVNFTVVGDEKQSIYAFRGADVRLFREARRRIAADGGANGALNRSFRTHAALVGVTNAFFNRFMPGPSSTDSTAATFAPLSAERQTAPHPSEPCEVHVITTPRKVKVAELRAAEAHLIAHRIQSLLAEGRVVTEGGHPRPLQYRDVAVLLRVRTHLPVYEEALFRAGLPYSVQGGRGLLDRPEVRDLSQLLAFLAQPADDLALAAVLRSPLFGWSDTELLALTKERAAEQTLWQALRGSQRCPTLLQELMNRRAHFSASALVTHALAHTEHAAVMATLPDGHRRLANIDAFLELLYGWATQGRGDVQGAAAALQDTLRLELPVAEASLASDDAVQIMTIHGSKGLEFPVVIVPDLLQQGRTDSAALLMDAEDGLALRVPGVPGARQPRPYQQLQGLHTERRASEAERLMYVALTRAADLLILSATAKASEGPEVSRLTSHFPTTDVARFGYRPERIPRAQPQVFRRTGTVHNAQQADATALPETLPVTSLGVYLSCPRRFEYRYVTGRAPFTRLWERAEPGTKAGASGALIGSAVHQAIELGWKTPQIEAGFPHLSAEERTEVSSLVQSLASPAFSALPQQSPRREVPLSIPFEGLMFEGVVDADYGPWIVDYKTDRQMRPEHHAPQLALYLQATGATIASLAYLRQNTLYTLSEEEVARGRTLAHQAVNGIQAHAFAPTPSTTTCRFCLYQGVCDQAVTVPGAAAS